MNDASDPARPDTSGWQRTLWMMVGIQCVMTGSFTIISPILPLFLPDLGVHDPQAIDLWTGVLNGTTSFVAALVSPLWGRLSDRKGRKLMLLRSGIAISVFTVLMGLAHTVWEFFGYRAAMGAFAGFTAAAITLVASQVPEARLGYALGWLSTGQLVGSLAGPIVGGLAADATGSFRVPFFMTAVLTLAATLASWFLVHERFTPGPAARQRVSTFRALRMVAASAGLLPLFVVLLFAQFGARTVEPVVTLYVQEMLGNVPSLATLGGLAFSVTGLGDVIASPFLGKRSDAIGYRRVLLISLAGAAVFTLPQAFTNNYWMFVAARFGVGMFIGGILPTANALVGRLAPPDQRGMVFGLTASATFLGNSLGPLTGGAVAAAFGISWVFVVTTAVMAANFAWVAAAIPASVDARR
ncbi:MAG: MFS transporter [Proteobacteria bacterium]|nr:MFS transporter [Pseudomonadota bacterium]